MVARRSALQRLLRLGEITKQSQTVLLEGLRSSAWTLEELRDAALDEVKSAAGEGTELAPAQTELAVKAAYYMIIADTMALRREGYASTTAEDGDDVETDDRSVAAVIGAMLSNTRGVHQAYSIVRAGRSGDPLLEVDDDGYLVEGSDEPRVLTNEIVRNTYNNEPMTHATHGAAGARRRWDELVTDIAQTEKATKTMAAVKVTAGSAQTWLEANGWPLTDVRNARERLDWVSRQLASWGDAHQAGEEDVD